MRKPRTEAVTVFFLEFRLLHLQKFFPSARRPPRAAGLFDFFVFLVILVYEPYPMSVTDASIFPMNGNSPGEALTL